MKQVHERKRAQLTGKGKTYSFLMLPRYILQSPEFIHLDPFAKALFMHWAGCFNGFNNGDFSAAKNRYADFGFNSPATLQKAKRTLLATRFAVLTRQGQKRKCSLYGLTIWPIDDCNGKLEVPSERVASNAWKNNSDGHQVSLRGTRRVLKLVKEAA